jgi:hypothetical protein
MAKQSLGEIVQFKKIVQVYPIVSGRKDLDVSDVIGVPMGAVHAFNGVVYRADLLQGLLDIGTVFAQISVDQYKTVAFCDHIVVNIAVPGILVSEDRPDVCGDLKRGVSQVQLLSSPLYSVPPLPQSLFISPIIHDLVKKGFTNCRSIHSGRLRYFNYL